MNDYTKSEVMEKHPTRKYKSILQAEICKSKQHDSARRKYYNICRKPCGAKGFYEPKTDTEAGIGMHKSSVSDQKTTS